MSLPSHQLSCLLSLWTEFPANASPVSHGYIETPVGQRLYFTSLAQFSNLLGELSGWTETSGPPEPPLPGQPPDDARPS